MNNDSEIIYKKLINNEPFCFIRLNDGECSAIKNYNSVLARGLETSDINMSNKLKQCLTFEKENYFVGLPCKLCYPDLDNFINNIINKNNKHFINANCLINNNYDKTFKIFTENLKNRNIVIITNDEMVKNINKLNNINIFVNKVITVSSKNAFCNSYEKIKNCWKEIDNCSVVISLCGPLGRIISKELFEKNDTLTCLELGSFFDPILNNKSYLYHTKTLKYCQECTNQIEYNDTEIMKYINEENFYKECIYLDSFDKYKTYFNDEKIIKKNLKNIIFNYPDNYTILKILNENFYKYRNLKKKDLYSKCNYLYNVKNILELKEACETYLCYFKELKEEETFTIKFYYAFSLFNINKDLSIKIFEELYNEKNLSQNIKTYTEYNLKNLYTKNTNLIPKIIHLIYFKGRELKIYNYVCLLSMLKFMPSYKIYIHNDIEPKDNIYWQKIKNISLEKDSKIEIIKTKKPVKFDGLDITYLQYAADIKRLELLYKYGGIYLDFDMLIFKNFENLIKDGDIFISYEHSKNNGYINSIIISKKNNEYIKKWLESFKIGLRFDTWAYHINQQKKNLLENNNHYIIKYNIKFFKSEYFLNFKWEEKNKFINISDNINENMYGLHLFETINGGILENNSFFLNYER